MDEQHQSCHQQGPLLRDAGSQEEEGVVYEEALEQPSVPDVALDRVGGGVWVSAHPVWVGAEASSDLGRGGFL